MHVEKSSAQQSTAHGSNEPIPDDEKCKNPAQTMQMTCMRAGWFVWSRRRYQIGREELGGGDIYAR